MRGQVDVLVGHNHSCLPQLCLQPGLRHHRELLVNLSIGLIGLGNAGRLGDVVLRQLALISEVSAGLIKFILAGFVGMVTLAEHTPGHRLTAL